VALIPMRSQRGLPSGKSSKRAVMGLVPMARFHASLFGKFRPFESQPTPNRVAFVSGSAISVAILRAAFNRIPSSELEELGGSSAPKFAGKSGKNSAGTEYRRGRRSSNRTFVL